VFGRTLEKQGIVNNKAFDFLEKDRVNTQSLPSAVKQGSGIHGESTQISKFQSDPHQSDDPPLINPMTFHQSDDSAPHQSDDSTLIIR
jgi:hypothetical protein